MKHRQHPRDCNASDVVSTFPGLKRMFASFDTGLRLHKGLAAQFARSVIRDRMRDNAIVRTLTADECHGVSLVDDKPKLSPGGTLQAAYASGNTIQIGNGRIKGKHASIIVCDDVLDDPPPTSGFGKPFTINRPPAAYSASGSFRINREEAEEFSDAMGALIDSREKP